MIGTLVLVSATPRTGLHEITPDLQSSTSIASSSWRRIRSFRFNKDMFRSTGGSTFRDMSFQDITID